MTNQLKGASVMKNAKIAAATGLVGLILVATMAAAWACTALATLEVAPAAGISGQEVAGKGYGYHGQKRAGLASPSQVEVRWQSIDGPVVWKGFPDPSGNLKFTFKLPEGAPGYYTVIASQKTAEGREINGGPARATVALNNPPKPATPGAGDAGTVDQQTAGEAAPSGIVRHQAPAAKAPVAQEQPVLRQDPAPVIRPSGDRSFDILASNSRDASSPVANAAIMTAIVGAGALLLAVGAAAVSANRRAKSQG